MLIYLVRHAIAVERGTNGIDDHDRPLTEKGIGRMAQGVRGLDAIGVTLDAIWTSPLRRARQTAEILETLKKSSRICNEEAEGTSRIQTVDILAPGGDAMALTAMIETAQHVNSLALVGHEPDLSELAGAILFEKSQSAILLKKGAVCCIEIAGGCAILQWVLQPQVLRMLANR
ncbi:MAG: phosphohistidine phosphatase SixA [Planctomycetes bacterium]|nr:phosphohistidine phosphatase SixA [Planctomycetota bacterium]